MKCKQFSHANFNIPASLLAVLLLALAVLHPVSAAETSEDTTKKAAAAAMVSWLRGTDAGRYADSWKQASTLFKKAVSSSEWETALKSARTPLGPCIERKLASALFQQEVPMPGGITQKGEFVVAQYESSFANLKYALEIITFEKESDGVWRASGYYIKSR